MSENSAGSGNPLGNLAKGLFALIFWGVVIVAIFLAGGIANDLGFNFSPSRPSTVTTEGPSQPLEAFPSFEEPVIDTSRDTSSLRLGRGGERIRAEDRPVQRPENVDSVTVDVATSASVVPTWCDVALNREDEARYTEEQLVLIRISILTSYCEERIETVQTGTEVILPAPVNRTLQVRWRLTPRRGEPQ